MASSMEIRGSSSRIDPTLKNQFLQVSLATSAEIKSLQKVIFKYKVQI